MQRKTAGLFLITFILALVMAAPAAAREKRTRGPRDLSDGVIQSVRCRGKTLTLALKTPHETLRLYSSDYFQVEFTALNFTPHGKLNPCKEIQGMKARAVFYDVPAHPDEGELISVELSK